MSQPPADNGFAPPPAVLPIFPLTGSLLLPGNFMPLNIFEPRYRNMVEDVLAGAGHIGMVQPVRPGLDQLGLGEETPALYSIGCAGLLESAERQDDGRFLILLRGAIRFRIAEEVESRRGYRRVRADYQAFIDDTDEQARRVDRRALLSAVEAFGQRRELEFDMDLLASLAGQRLVNALAAALPFAPAEQQALLETPNAAHRQRLLIELMRMEEATPSETQGYVTPTVN